MSLFLSVSLRAQESQSPVPPPQEIMFFAQSMLNMPDEAMFVQLNTSLKNNPYIKVARVDWISRRVFVITKDIDSFSEEQFLSWLGDYSGNASCIQTGLYGFDEIRPYPFTNCPD